MYRNLISRIAALLIFTLQLPMALAMPMPEKQLFQCDRFGINVYQFGPEGLAVEVDIQNNSEMREALTKFLELEQSVTLGRLVEPLKTMTLFINHCRGDLSNLVMDCQSSDTNFVRFSTIRGPSIYDINPSGKSTVAVAINHLARQAHHGTFQGHEFILSAYGDNLRDSGMGETLYRLTNQVRQHITTCTPIP